MRHARMEAFVILQDVSAGNLLTLRRTIYPLALHHKELVLTLPLDMRRDVQEIFRATPHHKQVMMFSATLSKDVRATCKKFMQSVSSYLEIDAETSLLRFTSTTRPSSLCTVFNNSTSNSRRRRRTENSTICSTTWSSTRHVLQLGSRIN